MGQGRDDLIRLAPIEFLLQQAEYSSRSLPGSFGSMANSINNAGQAVGFSFIRGDLSVQATEWSGGSVIDLRTLPGSFGGAVSSINDAGRAVG
jgi:uncharacterized membrane protein